MFWDMGYFQLHASNNFKILPVKVYPDYGTRARRCARSDTYFANFNKNYDYAVTLLFLKRQHENKVNKIIESVVYSHNFL